MANLPRITDAVPLDLAQQVQDLETSNTIIVGKFGEDRENELTEVKTLKEAFQTYEPAAEVNLTTADGDQHTELLRFHELNDFNVEKLVPQSPTLTTLSVTADVYSDLKSQLAKSPKWKKVFEDPQTREGLVDLLEQMLTMLDPEGRTKGEDEGKE